MLFAHKMQSWRFSVVDSMFLCRIFVHHRRLPRCRSAPRLRASALATGAKQPDRGDQRRRRCGTGAARRGCGCGVERRGQHTRHPRNHPAGRGVWWGVGGTHDGRARERHGSVAVFQSNRLELGFYGKKLVSSIKNQKQTQQHQDHLDQGVKWSRF